MYKIIARFSLILLLVPFLPISAFTFYWDSLGGEPGFSVDVPGSWDYHYKKAENGVLFTASQDGSLLEVRSMLLDREYSQLELVNLRAARLTAKYNSVRLLREDTVKDRQEMHMTIWDVHHKGRSYREYAAFLSNGSKAIILSLLVPVEDVKKRQVVLANAVYSLKMEGFSKGEPPEEVEPKQDILSESAKTELMNVIIFNRPKKKGEKE